MKLTICIDDTDVIGSKGTGEIAEELGALLQHKGMGVATAVSRHQLYVHDDIPYTSHNSAMCFELHKVGVSESDVIKVCIDYLTEQSADGSDPGLAVANEQSDWARLIRFGQQAKCQVLNKTNAYLLAQLAKVHLSEHGGTGDGIIGALAGLGLRRQGSDGRMKGQITICDSRKRMTVADLLRNSAIDDVLDLKHNLVDPSIAINLSGKLKAVRLNSRNCLLVYKDPLGQWHNAGREHLKEY